MTHTCPIHNCPFDVPLSQLMCKGHWKLVPKPIQHEVYACYRKHRGKPAHLAAIKRACESVNRTIAAWAKQKADADAEKPAPALPYRDD